MRFLRFGSGAPRFVGVGVLCLLVSSCAGVQRVAFQTGRADASVIAYETADTVGYLTRPVFVINAAKICGGAKNIAMLETRGILGPFPIIPLGPRQATVHCFKDALQEAR